MGFVLTIAALAPTTIFAQANTAVVRTLPIRYGIVVDNSGSLRMQLENIIDTVKAIVDENHADDETFLVRFIDSTKVVLIQELTSEKQQIYDAAEGMYIEGGKTAILDALSFSAKYLVENNVAGGDTRNVMILISDGDDSQNTIKIEQLLAQLKTSKISVFAVGIADAKIDTKLMDTITKQTGGKIFLPKGLAERRAAAKELAIIIRGK